MHVALAGQLAAPDTSGATGATYLSFEVPGPTCLPAFVFCTHPTAISAAGGITGLYSDTIGAIHGFLRMPNGTITAFDGPGSVCPGFFYVCTWPAGINPEGAVTGFYCDAIACHGFLRSPNGTFTMFDPTGSVYTSPNAINIWGAITGSYYDATGLEHGFLRAPGGAITAFDPPGSDYTSPSGINDLWAIAGSWQNTNSPGIHGFLRAPTGTFTVFDFPGCRIYLEHCRHHPDGDDRGIVFGGHTMLSGIRLRAKPLAYQGSRRLMTSGLARCARFGASGVSNSTSRQHRTQIRSASRKILAMKIIAE